MEMMDRLSAEEDIAATTAVAVGRGMKSGQWMRDAWRRLQRMARGRRREQAVRPSMDDLAAAGIAVTVVERKKIDG